MKIQKSKQKKISTIFFSILLLCSLISIPVHAVDPVSAGAALASAMDAYGMAYGIGSVYNVSDENGVIQSFDGLWDEFSLYQSNNGDSYNYQDFYDNFDDSPSVQAFTHSSGKFAGFYIDQESAEVFDKFWNWLLSGPAEMVKVDNAYQWNTENDSIITPVVWDNFSSFFLTPKTFSSKLSATESSFNSIPPDILVASNTSSRFYNINNSTFYMCRVGTTLYFISPTQFNGTIGYIEYIPANYTKYYSNTYIPGNYDARETTSSYWYCPFNVSSTPVSTNLPVYSSGAAACQALYQYRNGVGAFNVSVKPYDENDTSITLPDVTSPNYQPTAKEIITNTPWDESFDDTDKDENGLPIPFPPSAITPVIGDMIDSIIEDGFSIEEDPQPSDPDTPPPAPSEVFTPLLPVNPPSFNFNFSGIWHYVREWVSSLGAWFSLVFSVWAILPYAIVVPVYATAVIVIVLGVYKRFFM